MRRIQLMFAAVVLAAAVTLAACGGRANTSGSSTASGNFCDLVRQFKNDKTITGPAYTLAEAKRRAQVSKSATDQLAAAAPSQIKSEMQALQKVYTDLVRQVDSAAFARSWASPAPPFDDPAALAVRGDPWQKVIAYEKQHCGTTLGS